MNNDTSTVLANLLSDILEETVAPDQPAALLIEDYGANSMDIVDIVMQIERKLGVRIPDDDIPKITTFGDLLDRVTEAR